MEQDLQKPCRLVEFYDGEYLENMISLLNHSYSGVTYVYFAGDNEPDQLTRDILSGFIRRRWGLKTDFLVVSRSSVGGAMEAFEALTREEACDFDITGGSSVFIAAAGALAGRFPERSIRIHEYDPAAGRCSFRYPEGGGGEKRSPQLTIPEIMALQKIQILDAHRPIRYDLEKDGLGREILRLWNVVRRYLRAWNTLSVTATRREGAQIRKRMTRGQWKTCQPMLAAMEREGILSGLTVEQGRDAVVTYRLETPACTDMLYEKGGNLLELLTYLALERSGGFEDCCTGIMLDWELEDRPVSGNPFNEIDVLGVRRSVPFLISCKNAQVKNDFLYEILTMTRHFGGRYAVPVLVTTAWCSDSIRTRAREMGVVLIDNLRNLSGEAFCRKLKSRLCGRTS